MGIQIASVSIGTKLDLTGFNQGLGSISSIQAPTARVRVKIDASSIEQERQRLEKLLSRNLTIKVKADHKELYELNKHIELKRNHVRDVNSWMGKNPIKVKVDDSELKAANNFKPNTTTSSTTQSSQDTFDTSKLEKAIKGIGKKSIFSSIGDVALAPLKAMGSTLALIVNGALEGIGTPLGKKFGEGVLSGVESQTSELIGSFNLVGKTLGQSFSKDLISAFSDSLPSLKKTLAETLGNVNVIQESALKRSEQDRQASKTKKIAEQKITEEYAQLKPQLPKLAERSKQNEQRRVAITESQKALEDKVQAEVVAKDKGGANQQLDTAVGTQQSLRKKIGRLGKAGSNIGAIVGKTESDISLLKEDLTTATPKDAQAINKKISQKESYLNKAKGKYASVNNKIGSIQGLLSAVNNEITTHKNTIEELRNEVAESFKADYEQIKKDVELYKSEEKTILTALKPLEDAKALGLDKKRIATKGKTVNNDPLLYQNIAHEVAKSSGIKLNNNNIPKLVSSTNLPVGANAGYFAQENEIHVPPEVLEAIQANKLTAKQLETLVHELRHGAQFGFGAVDNEQLKTGNVDPAVELLTPAGDELKSFRRNIEGSVSVHAPEHQKVSREVEADAYTFAARNYEQIGQKASEKTRFEQAKKERLKAIEETTGRLGIGGGKLDTLFQQKQLQQAKGVIQGYKTATELNLPAEVLSHLKDEGEKTKQEMFKLQNLLHTALAPLESIDLLPTEEIKGIEEKVTKEVAELIGQSEAMMLQYRSLVVKAAKGENVLPKPANVVTSLPENVSQKNIPTFSENLNANYTSAGLKKVANKLGIGGTGSKSKEKIIESLRVRFEHDRETVEKVIESFGDEIKKTIAKTGVGNIMPVFENSDNLISQLKGTYQELKEAFQLLENSTGAEEHELLIAIASEAQAKIQEIDEITKSYKLPGKVAQSVSGYRQILSESRQTAESKLVDINKQQITTKNTLSQGMRQQSAMSSVGGNSMDLSVADIHDELNALMMSAIGTKDGSVADLEYSMKDILDELKKLIDAPLLYLRQNNPSSETTASIESELNNEETQNIVSGNQRITPGGLNNAYVVPDEIFTNRETIFDRISRIIRSGSLPAVNDLFAGLSGLLQGFLAFQGVQFFQSMISGIAPACLDAATAMESLERRFTFVSGSAKKGAANLAFVRGEVKRLGTDIKSSMEGFAGLAASTRDTALEGQTQKVFSGVSQASTVFDLNSEQQGRVFTAVQQIASKGKVNAEELRQQLGESLPGAFQIAARAMGMTTTALDKMMSEGKLLSDEFLPKFAQQLSAETALGVKGAANSSVSALIRFNNALFEMQATLGKTMLPVRNFLLSIGGKAFEFISQNAELLLRVFQSLSIIIGIKLVGSFAQLASSLMKIPMVAKVASTAMLAFNNVAPMGGNKLRATQMVENAGEMLSNVRATPVNSLKQGASNLGNSIKDFGINSLDSAKGKISTLGESINNFRSNSLNQLSGGFGSAATNAKAFGKAALVNGVSGMMGMVQGARALLTALAPMLKMFIAIELGTAVFKGIQAAFSDSSGASREFADTAVENLDKYKKALAEARGETDKFKTQTQTRDESLLDTMGIGALLPKTIKDDANLFDKFRFSAGETVTRMVEEPANLLKFVSGGRWGGTYEDKKLSENMRSVGDIRGAVNSTSSEMLTMLGGKGKGALELAEIKKYDDQLRKIQTRRAASVAKNPDDKASLKAIDEEQNKILTSREKASKPIGILQSNMQSNIDGIKKEIEKYEKLASEPGKNQAQYKQVLDGLKGDLGAAEKIQDKFNRSVGESVNAFTLMQRNIQGVADKLADAEDKSALMGNSLKANLYNSAKSQGELQFGLSDIELKQQESKLARLVDAKNQTSALLQNKDAQNTLNAYGITENTGKAELKTLADKTGDRVNDKYVLEQYASLQEKNIEISNLQTGLAQSKQELNQKIYELNKQVNEYYRGVTRQFAESTIQLKQQSSQLQTQSYATELKGAISGFSDNIVSTFVDNIVESIQQLSDAADKKFDVETAVLQANNQFEDAIKQGDELKRQLPKYEISNGEMPSIPVTLDFSSVGKDADLSKLNDEVGKTVDNTKELTKLTGSYPDLINESINATQDWSSANADVADSVKDLELDFSSTNDSIQSNIDSASELGSGIESNIYAATDFGGQVDINTGSLQDNNSAVLDVDSSLNTAIATTGNVNEATTSWLGTTGQVSTEINTNVNSGLVSVSGGIEGLTTKTVDWFKTFANNVPILNQLGQIFASWGQQLAGIGSTIAGFGQGVVSGAGDLIGQGVDTVKGILGLSNTSGKVTEKYQTGLISGQEYLASRDGGSRRHAGQDIDVSGNQQAQSFIGGIVTRVVHDRDGAGYGSYVDVYNKALGVVERIAEVLDVNVKEGQTIAPGQAIGGGESHTGVFHYEIRKPVDAQGRGGYGVEGTQDPIKFYEKLGIAKREGTQIKILAGLNAGQSLKASEHGVGDGHNHFGEDDVKKANVAAAGKGTMALSPVGGGATPKLGAGYSSLESLGGELATNKYFDPKSPEGRARMAIALGIGGAEVYSKGSTSKDYFTRRGGTDNNMLGFGQYNLAYHTDKTNTPEKYKNFMGSQLAGERLLPNSQQGMDYGKGLSQAVASGSVQNGQQLIAWMKANKLGGSNWQGVDDGWGRVPELADKLVAYLKSNGAGGIQAQSGASFSANAGASGAVSNWKPVATPGVWTPNGMVGGSALSQVGAKGTEAVNKATGMAEIQRARQIELAQKKAENESASATANALKTQGRAFRELEKGLRENGLKVTSLSDEVTDTNLEYQGALDTEQQRQQAQRNLDKKYATLENNLVDQRKEIESQVETAKTLLSKGGIISPEMRGKVQSLIDNPNIKENLREQLRTSLSSGALGDGGKELLQRAMTEGQAQLGKLDTSLAAVRKGRGESKTLIDEKFAREEKLRKQSAGFDIESASIDTLKAKLEQLQAVQSRSPFAPEVKAIPSIQKVIAAREEQLKLEQKLREIDEKEKVKTYTKSEADALRKEINARKVIVDDTIKQNAVQAEAVMTREQDNRNREAAIELANAELGKDKQRLEQLKILAQTSPLSPELANNAIPELERKIQLKEAELKLTQDIAAIEQEGFENKRTPEEVAKKKADTTSAYETQVKNINAQADQAVFANEISQQKTLLEIKKQQLDYQTSIVEAISKAINLGIRQGDPLKLNYDAQRSQMELSVESQVLEMKEFANKTGKSKEEVAALEKQIRDLNGLNLENLAAEFKKSVDDRAFGIRQRLGSSGTELLESQASFYSGRGMNFKAQDLQRQSAMVQQQSSYEGQKRDLEEFIKTNQVASDAAQQLRDNLEAVNQVKFDTIKDNFNAFKPVIDSVGTAIEDGLVNVFKTGKFDVNAFFDTIFSSMAKLAASWIKEKLLGSIMGGGKNKGKGGMFAENKKDETKQDPLSALIGGDKGKQVGLTAMAPMYVNVVNAGAMGSGNINGQSATPFADYFGLNNDKSATPFSDYFGFGGLGSDGQSATPYSDYFGFGGISQPQSSGGGDFLSSLLGGGSIFGGDTKFGKSNPFPVGIEKSAPDAFSSLAGTISGIFGGGGGAAGGGLGGILGSVTGLLGGGGGGGGLGGILGMIMPLFGGLFATGGVIGGSARSPKDDQLILAQKGEGILTHKGMDAIGGGAVLGAINDGRINFPKFAEGGVVGGGYVSNTGEYGSSRTTDKVAGRASEPREVNVKMETTSINGVEYLTKEQGQELAQKAAQEGAKNGATYVQDKFMNSVSFRNRLGVR